MNIIFWVAIQSLMLTNLPNIHGPQVPGYDWLGGSRDRPPSVIYKLPTLKVPIKSELYTCVNDHRSYHQTMKAFACWSILPSGKHVKCSEAIPQTI